MILHKMPQVHLPLPLTHLNPLLRGEAGAVEQNGFCQLVLKFILEMYLLDLRCHLKQLLALPMVPFFLVGFLQLLVDRPLVMIVKTAGRLGQQLSPLLLGQLLQS